jgi:hypothetical protein
MRKLRMLAAGLVLLVGFWAIGSRVVTAQVFSNDARISLMDNCDPVTLAPFCIQTAHSGDVGIVEFLALLYSPLSKTIIGHPSFRFEPAYLDIREGQALRLTNNGGDVHTFTEVVQFGGGLVPGLNGAADPTFPPPPVGTIPLTVAPECPLLQQAAFLGPGQTAVIKPSNGNHKYQCCIHPWMRAVVGVGE